MMIRRTPDSVRRSLQTRLASLSALAPIVLLGATLLPAPVSSSGQRPRSHGRFCLHADRTRRRRTGRPDRRRGGPRAVVLARRDATGGAPAVTGAPPEGLPEPADPVHVDLLGLLRARRHVRAGRRRGGGSVSDRRRGARRSTRASRYRSAGRRGVYRPWSARPPPPDGRAAQPVSQISTRRFL